MKLDVNHKPLDPRCRLARVHLNGRELKNCVMADEELGVVEVYKVDAKGNVEVVGSGNRRRALTVLLKGTVTITLPPDYEAQIAAFMEQALAGPGEEAL